MLKKKALWLIAATLLVVAAISGTTAYFVKEFTSDNNTATAATFDVDVVDADGNTIADGQFNLDGELYPGMDTIVAYQFDVMRNNTELPFEYTVDLTGSGGLFPEDGSSPIALTMQKQDGDDWVEVNYDGAIVPEADVESYRILVDWPHGDNDIDFQGLTGTLTLNVVATQVDMPVVPEETGEVHVMLYKDSTSSSNRIEFDNLTNYYLKSKDTGLTYSEGDYAAWNNPYAYVFQDVPIGEYTLHFDMPEGMYTGNILLGSAYQETDYDPDSNPIVVIEDERGYVKVILKSSLTLDTINPPEDLRVPSDITYEAFREALPTHTTIVDSEGNVHEVELDWDVRPFNFDRWSKPGEVRIKSDLFKLPVNVSNSDPSQRLEVYLNVIFE